MKTKTTFAIYDPLGNILGEFYDQRFAAWVFSQLTDFSLDAVLDYIERGDVMETEGGYKLVVID